MRTVIVVGAGAAGLMAAVIAAREGAKVLLLEKMEMVGKKMGITGKGRCNITNVAPVPDLIANTPGNGKFLISAYDRFDNNDLLAMLTDWRLATKVERGGRVFPVSDSAPEVRNTFLRVFKGYGGTVHLKEPVKSIIVENGRAVGVKTEQNTYRGDAVILATGGMSYPLTGSTGDGYKLAQQAGHTLVEPVPSLVSLVSHDPDCKKMMGLALKNVTLTLFEDGKDIFEEQGEMLFTHFGISGPLTLSASSHLGDMKKHRYIAEIDLKPALSEEQLYDRITRDFALLANHAAQGALVKLLPASMQPVMVARWGIDPATKANQITREQKRELVRLVKHWQVSIDARGDLAHAVITSGGVSVREVDPKTMQSKKALGLYFAGEVLDVDAYTGGYNLQIAFCTAQSFANNL